jgi:hypothetical protein
MKNNRYFTSLRLVLTAALLLTGMSSCVKDGMGDCPDPRGNVRLIVRLDEQIESDGGDTGGYRIDKAMVYVFDSVGRYVTFAEGGEFDGKYEFWFTLPSGDFDFVVWTNQGEFYRAYQTAEELEVDGLAMDNLEIYLDHGGKTLTDPIPDLLHGIERGTAIVATTDNLVEMEISPLTYTVNLKALNLPSANRNYTFTITDNNSHYDFEGQLIEGKDNFRHTRTAKAPDGEFNASIRTLVLNADRHPRFSFTDAATGETLYEACLTQTITKAYQAASRTVDFSKTHTYDIVLRFDAATMECTVSVNGWDYDERPEILD